MRRERSDQRRRICFVTGTRAEFGLMTPVLEAIRDHRELELQIVATGMHLDRRHGEGLAEIRRLGWHVDRTIPWKGGGAAAGAAKATGRAIAGLTIAFEHLASEIVLVAGDRVEAFAAASAAAIGGLVVAHVHGGDRARGQVDDSLRHAITKLAHVHFAASPGSARRLQRMGEQRWRIHRVGSPGLDGIAGRAAARAALARAFPELKPREYALVVLHPVEADPVAEARRARSLLACVLKVGVTGAMIVGPNNDPGGGGIQRAWREVAEHPRVVFRPDVPRGLYLGLLRDAAMLVGNSSSGIIEAASFGTPVIDIGPRQKGRERGENVRSVTWSAAALRKAIEAAWAAGRAPRIVCDNPYGGGGAGRRIADVLASVALDVRVRRKLIAY